MHPAPLGARYRSLSRLARLSLLHFDERDPSAAHGNNVNLAC